MFWIWMHFTWLGEGLSGKNGEGDLQKKGSNYSMLARASGIKRQTFVERGYDRHEVELHVYEQGARWT